MRANTSTRPNPAAPAAIEASVWGRAGEQAQAYRMFEASELSPVGAFFAGTVWFERGEELDIELSMPGGRSMRLRARITGLERGDRPGMRVSFAELSDEDRKRLEDGLADAGA
jgi:hypothetical protein